MPRGSGPGRRPEIQQLGSEATSCDLLGSVRAGSERRAGERRYVGHPTVLLAPSPLIEAFGQQQLAMGILRATRCSHNVSLRFEIRTQVKGENYAQAGHY